VFAVESTAWDINTYLTMLLWQSPEKLIATRAMTSGCEQSSNKTGFSGDKLSTVRIKVRIDTTRCHFVVSFGLHHREAVASDAEPHE